MRVVPVLKCAWTTQKKKKKKKKSKVLVFVYHDSNLVTADNQLVLTLFCNGPGTPRYLVLDHTIYSSMEDKKKAAAIANDPRKVFGRSPDQRTTFSSYTVSIGLFQFLTSAFLSTSLTKPSLPSQ